MLKNASAQDFLGTNLGVNLGTSGGKKVWKSVEERGKVWTKTGENTAVKDLN